MDDLNNIKGEQKPDVILLDLNMPLKDGFKVLKEIKSNPKFQAISYCHAHSIVKQQ